MNEHLSKQQQILNTAAAPIGFTSAVGLPATPQAQTAKTSIFALHQSSSNAASGILAGGSPGLSKAQMRSSQQASIMSKEKQQLMHKKGGVLAGATTQQQICNATIPVTKIILGSQNPSAQISLESVDEEDYSERRLYTQDEFEQANPQRGVGMSTINLVGGVGIGNMLKQKLASTSSNDIHQTLKKAAYNTSFYDEQQQMYGGVGGMQGLKPGNSFHSNIRESINTNTHYQQESVSYAERTPEVFHSATQAKMNQKLMQSLKRAVDSQLGVPLSISSGVGGSPGFVSSNFATAVNKASPQPKIKTQFKQSCGNLIGNGSSTTIEPFKNFSMTKISDNTGNPNYGAQTSASRNVDEFQLAKTVATYQNPLSNEPDMGIHHHKQQNSHTSLYNSHTINSANTQNDDIVPNKTRS